MRIVRTVGQAFDVCHQLTLQQTGEQISEDGGDTSTADAKGADAVPGVTGICPRTMPSYYIVPTVSSLHSGDILY